MKHIHTFENFLTENAGKKITVSVTSSAIGSFKKDLDANKIPYFRSAFRPTVFELDDTPKVRTAIEEVKGRFGMQSVLVKELKENTLSEGRVKVNESVNENAKQAESELNNVVKKLERNEDAIDISIALTNHLMKSIGSIDNTSMDSDEMYDINNWLGTILKSLNSKTSSKLKR